MLYNIPFENVEYQDAKALPVPNFPERAVIRFTNHMVNHEWWPRSEMNIDASVLFQACMGFDPEEFTLESNDTRCWVEDFSYPLEMANSIVKHLNTKS